MMSFTGGGSAEDDGFLVGLVQALVLLVLGFLLVKWGWGVIGAVGDVAAEAAESTSRTERRANSRGAGYAYLLGGALGLGGLICVAGGGWWVWHLARRATGRAGR